MMTFLCFPPMPPWPWSKVLAHLISQSKHVTLSLANLPTYHAKYSIVEPCHASSSFLLCCLHFCCGKSANKTFNGDEPNISELKSYCSAFYHFVHGSAEHWPVEAGCTVVFRQPVPKSLYMAVHWVLSSRSVQPVPKSWETRLSPGTRNREREKHQLASLNSPPF